MEAIISIFKLLLIVMSTPLFWIYVIPIVLFRILYPKIRGIIGELSVRLRLSMLPKHKYLVLNDIMISNDYSTHQIDHIVISEYGIFVIETKNYNGLIVGNEYDEKWKECLGKRKYYFNNPIHQNYGHVKALETLLNIEEEKFIPIVCFSNTCRLRVNTTSTVLNLRRLRRIMKNFYKPLIDEDNMYYIRDIILQNNIKGYRNRRNHIKNIKVKLKEDQIKIDNMICPRCDNALVLRNGKYGTFKGCSKYPECRFMR